MVTNVRAILMGVALIFCSALSAFIAWQYQEKNILTLKTAIAEERSNAASNALKQIEEINKGILDAQVIFKATAERNQRAVSKLETSVSALGTATGVLRGEFAGLPARVADATRPALVAYSDACTAVFIELAERGLRLAEVGAGIAKAADGHAADSEHLRNAWPKSLNSQTSSKP